MSIKKQLLHILNTHPSIRYPLDNGRILSELFRYPYYVSRYLKNIALNKNPDEAMMKSRKYFSEEKERVEKITTWLADEESKETYQKMIQFRQTHENRAFTYHGIRNQYVPKGIISLTSNDVCIDCGAFAGDTAMRLYRHASSQKWGGAMAIRIVAFEPDPQIYNILKRYCEPIKTIIPKCAATYSSTTQLTFHPDSKGGKLTEDANANDGYVDTLTVDAVAIDDVEECADATFIKMDVEGAEMDTLIGAYNTIMRNKPKLAICLYHSDEDMIRIIEWVHENFPEYKLYVRHHSKYAIQETVLYAV